MRLCLSLLCLLLVACGGWRNDSRNWRIASDFPTGGEMGILRTEMQQRRIPPDAQITCYVAAGGWHRFVVTDSAAFPTIIEWKIDLAPGGAVDSVEHRERQARSGR